MSCIEVIKLINKGAAKVGLSFANDKAQVLLPKHWFPTTSGNILPAGLQVRSNTFDDPSVRGIEVVGAPVGSFDFCSNFVQNALNDMLRNAETLLQLHPQCATQLLRECVCPAPAYLSQVCHPNLTRTFLAAFDDSVWKIWLQALGGTGADELHCCSDVIF